MPDGDKFDRRIKRGWQTASRRMIGSGEGSQALPSVLRALGKEAKASGCPGIAQIISTLADSIRSPQIREARTAALAELDDIRLQHGNRATEIAVTSGRRLLASLSDAKCASMRSIDDGELRVFLASAILADIADAWMCPAAILHELIETGDTTYQEIDSRRQQNRHLIGAAPETHRMAVQLLADPSGTLVKTPQFRREKVSQSEILVTPLTR